MVMAAQFRNAKKVLCALILFGALLLTLGSFGTFSLGNASLQSARAETAAQQTSQILRDRASPDGFVLITTSNYYTLPFVNNFACNMKQLNNSHWLLAALDEHTTKYAQKMDWPVLPYEGLMHLMGFTASGTQPNRKELGVAKYNKVIQRFKYLAVLVAMQQGYKVIFTDCDIYYLSDPLNTEIKALARSHDIVISTGSDTRCTLNSGFFFANPDNAAVYALLRMVFDSELDGNDQRPFQRFSCNLTCDASRADGFECTTRYRGEGNIRWFYLDPDRYTPGQPKLHNSTLQWSHDEDKDRVNDLIFLKHSLYDKSVPRVYIHNNQIRSSTEGKMARFRLNGFWKWDDVAEQCTA